MVDLFRTRLVNPLVTVQFVKAFLVAAPSNKLLTFGGDYATVANVVGHAAIARRGLGQALSELVEPLMRGNARKMFPIFQTVGGIEM